MTHMNSKALLALFKFKKMSMKSNFKNIKQRKFRKYLNWIISGQTVFVCSGSLSGLLMGNDLQKAKNK